MMAFATLVAPSFCASAPPIPLHHPAVLEAADAVSSPVLSTPILRPLDHRRRYLDARTRPSFLKSHTKDSFSKTAATLTVSSKNSYLGKIQFGQQKQGFLYSQRLSPSVTMCSAALDATCCVGQTQTVQRQSKQSVISPLGPGMQKTPKLEKGGAGGPPHDGGGGGGGGGGGSSSGGFFLFAFLLFLRFVKDKEREMEREKEEAAVITDLDD